MRLALKSMQQAAELLVEYNGGARGVEAETELIRRGKESAAEDFERLGVDRYYRESTAIKYDLLAWHLTTPRWRFDYAFLPHLERPGTLVDFGAGIGLSAFFYASAGLEVIAVEQSLASDTVRFGEFLMRRLSVSGVTFVERLPEGPVDNATCIDVFEHFPDWREPARELVACLKPGGVLCLRAPFAADDPDRDHPQHFESPVPVAPFLASLGLEPVAPPGVWRRRG